MHREHLRRALLWRRARQQAPTCRMRLKATSPEGQRYRERSARRQALQPVQWPHLEEARWVRALGQ